MRLIEIQENLMIIIQMITISVILFRSTNFLRIGTRSMVPVFFYFANISMLINGIYWLIYDLQRPGIRMPFAANEFGEAAFLLLFASVLTSMFGDRLKREVKVILPCILFVTASACLWYAWSGEWVQDIITGLAFCYFLSISVMSVKAAEAFSRIEWRVFAAAAAALITGQTLTLLVPDVLKRQVDLCCYLLMFAVLIYLTSKCVGAIRKDASAEKLTALAMAYYVWSVSTMYMSSGMWYIFADLISTIAIVCIFIGIRKEVTGQ